jgi:hypothetical protein
LSNLLPANDPKSQTLVDVCNEATNSVAPFLADPIVERLTLMLAITQPCQAWLPEVHRAYLKQLWHYIDFRGRSIDTWSAYRCQSFQKLQELVYKYL